MEDYNAAKGKAAITGVGMTNITRNSGVSVGALVAEASLKAIKDAGLSPNDIDGIITYSAWSSIGVEEAASLMGMRNIQWRSNVEGGGPVSSATVGHAAMAVASGLCDHVLVYRALNGRSGTRMGKAVGRGQLADATRRLYDGPPQWTAPYGYAGPPMTAAMVARRHMALYGTKQEHLGAVAVALRANAVKNPRAIMRAPITMDDYHQSRWIAEPVHILDCCQETDAGAAVIVSRADLARNMPHRPAHILAFAYGLGQPGPADVYDDYTTGPAKYIAPGVWRRAGVKPADVSIAQIYDAFTICVITQLEDFGFCPKGEGGPFVADGNIAFGGKLPVGTQGGLLSEGYVHGMNNITEAVYQVRGVCGERQVKDPAIVFCSGGPGGDSALVLSR